jgi:hypothetical protein
MANYQIISQYPDVQVLGGGSTKDVQTIGVLTSPNNVYFETSVPIAQATTSYLRYTAQSYRDIYELLFDYLATDAVEWYQVPNASGLLVDHVRIYVTSSSGASTSVIDIPYSQLGQYEDGTKIAALRQALDNTEAS